MKSLLHYTSVLLFFVTQSAATDQLLFSFNIMTPGATQMDGQQLSAIGRRQMYLSGQAVNQELGGKFISQDPTFQWNGTHNQDVVIKTADYNPSIESAHAFMLGVYPQIKTIQPDRAQPLPKIKTRSFDDDSYNPMSYFRNVHVQNKDLDTFDPVLMCPDVSQALKDAYPAVLKTLEVKYQSTIASLSQKIQFSSTQDLVNKIPSLVENYQSGQLSLDLTSLQDLLKIQYEAKNLTLNSNLTMRDVMLSEIFSDMALMMQSVIDINEQKALEQTGDRVRYFLYITDQEARPLINMLNAMNVSISYLKEASILRFDLYLKTQSATDYDYQLRVTLNGSPLTSLPDPCKASQGETVSYQCDFIGFVQLAKDKSYYGYYDIDEYIQTCGSSDVPNPETVFSKVREQWLSQVDQTHNVYLEYEYAERILISLVIFLIMGIAYLVYDCKKRENARETMKLLRKQGVQMAKLH